MTGPVSTTMDETTTEDTTEPTDSSSSSSSDSSSTGEPIDPLCGDGLPAQGELCYDDPITRSFQDFPIAIEFVEFNGDGNLDVAIAIVDEVQYVLGDGEGGFGEVTSSTTFSISAGDFIDANGDGITDLAFAGFAGGGVSAQLAISDGVGFTIAAAAPELVDEPRFARAGNIRGGTDFDVAYATFNDRVYVHAGSALGIGGELENVGGFQPSDMELGDVNGDSRDDVIIAMPGEDPRLIRYLGASTGELLSSVDLLEPLGVAGVGLGPIALGDFNGDGDPDIAIGVEAAVVIAFNDGLGTFENPTLLATPDPANEVFAADLDGDGSDELVASFGPFGGPGTTGLYFVEESGISEGEELETDFAAFHYDAADVNGDTVPDLLVADNGGGDTAIFVSTL